MRLVFGIDPSPFRLLSTCAALCAALALATLPAGANAQASATDAAGVTAAQQAGIFVADETSNTADAAPASASTPVADADAAIGNEPDNSAQLLSATADGSARGDANGIALDDQVLSRQRGGAVGMVMVAATPQLMRGSSVTLWDEIAPPTPLPVPIDAARAAQGNVANYQRK
jgi:hypothetical protein